MMINNGTTVATVNNVFSTSRNVALIESTRLLYITISTKLHHCTFNELIPMFLLIKRLCLSLNTLRGPKKHPNTDFLTNFDGETVQAWVNIAFEDLQALNKSTNVMNHLFCSQFQCKCAGYTMFLWVFEILT